MPLIFLAAWLLVPNSYHQLQSQPILFVSPVPLPEFHTAAYSQQLPAKLICGQEMALLLQTQEALMFFSTGTA